MYEHRQTFGSLEKVLASSLALCAVAFGCEEQADDASAGVAGASDAAGAESGGSGDGPSSGGSPASSGAGGTSSAAGAAPSAGGGGGGRANDSGAGSGGSPGAAQGGNDGEGGGNGEGEDLSALCVYSADPDGGAGAAGAGGADAAAVPTIALKTHPILGQYLVDESGRTLYTVGRDNPGDCENDPVTDCVTSPCPETWPPFYAGQRVLGPGLDDGVFGTFQRPDGELQSTYFGWPLYYYKSDTSSGLVEGQGKQGLWHVAEVTPPLIVLKRVPGTTTNHLATMNGRTLYVHTADTLGSTTQSPVSNCRGECLEQHPPLKLNQLSVVTSLEPADFRFFVRDDGEGLQVAYKGAPLYFDIGSKVPGSVVSPMPENWGLAVK